MHIQSPQLWKWTSPPISEEEELHNASAHGAGITLPFRGDFFSDLPNREPFDAGRLWNTAIEASISSVTEELFDLIVLLNRRLPAMEGLDSPEPGYIIVENMPEDGIELPFNLRLMVLSVGKWSSRSWDRVLHSLGGYNARVSLQPNR
jgi:hypothetical protein